VTLSRKGAKSRTHGRKLRSSGTKARTRASRARRPSPKLEKQLAARTRELAEAREQQAATADVLKVISRSAFDLRTVLETLLATAARLCGVDNAQIFLREEETYRLAACSGFSREYEDFFKQNPLPPGRNTLVGRTALEGRIVHISDILADPGYNFPEAHRLGGYRTMLGVPLVRDGVLIGVLSLTHAAVKPFTARQIELVTTFADQAVIAIENVRLFDAVQARTRDLSEALEQQTATSEVLRVISGSPSEIQPVFEIIGERAEKLCDAEISVVSIVDGDLIRLASINGMTEDGVKAVRRVFPMRRGDETVTARAIRTGTICHVPDVLGDSQYQNKDTARVSGYRACLGVPMVRDGQVVGAIFVARRQPSLFADAQVQLLKTFADQAVIAVENVRLFNETKEALEQQTATSEVLRVISSSPGELEPVFQAMLENATRLCEAEFGTINFYDGDQFRIVAEYNVPTAFTSTRLRQGPFRPHPSSAHAHVVRSKQVFHIEDLTETPAYREGDPAVTAIANMGRARTIVVVPMLKESDLLGTMTVFRQEVRPFTAKQIELVSNFAKQAVIAIENTRLLNELRESLQQQTATSEVLKVISRSTFDLQAVLDTLVESAALLCEADQASVNHAKGDAYQQVACYGYSPEHRAYMDKHSVPSGRGSLVGRVMLEGRPVQIPDLQADPEYTFGGRKVGGGRTALGVPLLREGKPIGVINLQRKTVRPFTERQIELVTTFADQAVIALENTRLLNELRESLQQQTATADVLEVISRSAFDLQPVFETVAESSVRLCEADKAFIFRFDGELLRSVVAINASPELKEFIEKNPIRPGRDSGAGRAAIERRTVHIHDVMADREYTYGSKDVNSIRTVLTVPMLKGDDLLGVILTYRLEVRPFTDKQIALVETFADQAAIAIENVRLFDAVQQRTADLARSVEELRALGEVSQAVNSTLELQTVFDTIVANSVRLSGTDAGAIYVLDERQREFQLRATYGMSEELIAAIRNMHAEISEAVGLETEAHQPRHVADLRDLPPTPVNDTILRAGYRARLLVPLMRSGDVVGALVVRRKEPGEFPQAVVDLMQTFAEQSAIALENARLFNEIAEKSRELEIASQHKSQFVANMSHELRTPLAAILGYAELIQEGFYGPLPEKSMDVLTRIRANGKHLLGLINSVLDIAKVESGQFSLNLAEYALDNVVETVRAATESLAETKKLSLKTDVVRPLPVGVGDEQRLTQVLLNLVGNAIKFTDSGEVRIIAKAVDGHFAVGVTDTGPGIPLEEQKRVFEQFHQVDNSTTKAKGGTGLGLAIAKQIVEMHGGRIWVESTLGQGATFQMELPIRAEIRKGTA
jgi:GAF domain-containing protein